MYVCMCHGHREAEIREQARRGKETVEEAYAELGDTPACGTCVELAQEIIDEELASVTAEAA